MPRWWAALSPTAVLVLVRQRIPLHAQSLMVASHAVVIDERTRTGTMTIVNDGLTPVEATVSTFYGYPVTDSLGHMYLRTFSEIDDTMPSAAGWVQSFPRRLRIGAKSRTTVRLLVTPPPGLAPGEYWARIVVAAKTGKITPSILDRPDIQASLELEVRSVVGLFYRVGSPATGVAMSALRAAPAGDSLVGRIALARKGNAAFVGSLRAELRDADGRVRAERLLPLGVYYTIEPRFTVPIAQLPPGQYTLTLETVSRRPDLAPNLLLPVVPGRVALPVTLP